MSKPSETVPPESAAAPGALKDFPRRTLGRPAGLRSLALIGSSTRRHYHAMYKDIFEGGTLDRRVKELIAIGVSAATGCQGCLTGHIRKARAIGVPIEEIKEAVAVAFSVNAATVVDNADVAAALLGIEQSESEDA